MTYGDILLAVSSAGLFLGLFYIAAQTMGRVRALNR